jgi:phosphomannomutase
LAVFSTEEPEISWPDSLVHYYEQLGNRTSHVQMAAVLVEVGVEWVTSIREWLPGVRVEGAARTDPFATQPSEIARQQRTLIRVDEDLDKLVWWERGQRVPGQFLLADWIALRPAGRVCVSFDTSMFVQRHLAELGYGITTCPVGDQFVAECMQAAQISTGGEPNGHFIAAERSFCPDALASALDLLECGAPDRSWWALSMDGFYCRGAVAPFQLTLEEAGTQLESLRHLMGYEFSLGLQENAITASCAHSRVVLRISHFEDVAVLQTEGPHAKHLFDAISTCLSIESVRRKDEWIG